MKGVSDDDLNHRTKVDVGVTWRSRRFSGTRHHIVVRRKGTKGWVTLCDGSRAVREYWGWLEVAVTCEQCKAARG